MAAAAGGLCHMGRGAAPLQTSPQIFEHFLAPGNLNHSSQACYLNRRMNKILPQAWQITCTVPVPTSNSTVE